MNGFNLSLNGIATCIRLVLKQQLPVMLLGGGGYHHPNTARLWSLLTAVALGRTDLPQEIPDHECFLDYAPDYELHIETGLRRDRNDFGYIEFLEKYLKKSIEQL